MLKEDREVVGDLIGSFQILQVVSGVELLAQGLAHLVDLGYRVWELKVWLLGILVTDRAQDFELFVSPLVICSLLFVV
jgi:hypothetical protein